MTMSMREIGENNGLCLLAGKCCQMGPRWEFTDENSERVGIHCFNFASQWNRSPWMGTRIAERYRKRRARSPRFYLSSVASPNCRLRILFTCFFTLKLDYSFFQSWHLYNSSVTPSPRYGMRSTEFSINSYQLQVYMLGFLIFCFLAHSLCRNLPAGS